VVWDPQVRIQEEGQVAFSAIKRILGEYVAAGKFANMAEVDDHEGIHIQHIHCADLRPPMEGRPGEEPLDRSLESSATQP